MSDSANVLLVDDELVVLEAFVDILEDEGYKMFTAASGNAAVEILRANAIDVVVTDISMPGMDGLELLSIIREIDAEIPVIMATAYSSIENTVESMRRGASNYLIKPIKVELLRSVLAEATAKRRMLRQNRELTAQIKSSNDELKRRNQERQHVLEVIAQKLRQPLIDQMNWCELLGSDSDHSLHSEHREVVTKISRAAKEMFGQVIDLLDEEKIEERSRTTTSLSAEAQGDQAASVRAGQTPASSEAGADQQSRLEFRILLVEGCSIQRDLLVGALQRRFHVVSAGDGWEALTLMAERPHLIVTEFDLPTVGALEMIRHARRISDNFAVLVMCDAKDKPLLTSAGSSGVHETLLKPFRIGDLVARVEALLETARVRMDHSVMVVSPHAYERHGLYHLLDGRYGTQIAGSAQAVQAAVGRIDLLIIDVSAEEYSWKDIVQHLRRENRRIKVLALLDRRDMAMVQALGKGGVTSAMLKPYAVGDLLFRVRDLLGVPQVDERILRSVFRRLAV